MNTDNASRTIALVTGANKGIGRATAARLAARGATVLVGSRDPGRGEQAAAAIRADGGDARAVALDVTDQASIDRAAKEIEERYGRLDVLVNNAGISGSGNAAPQDAVDRVPSAVDLAVVREVFEVNVFGVIAVTNAMLPLLRRSPRARIVNLTSHAASLALYADPEGPFTALPSAAYSPSKTALNAITVQYANELRAEGIPVNAAAPGYVDTEINGNTGLLAPAQAAEYLADLALLEADGPTGAFTSADGPLPW
ncbi:SDR family NAD(P)-dependent oxidoreductase [Glycomyces artemisiae]|uniref:NAD(P)-dependent dehydrogenase (Short-subunit alcohol dehydrogenase family) n=1 Tax=Glycomyces artemisiae TaxID=1076443 RepID=A0A2T0US97_9ACTN|nr:SDR family NAD(P)-dependent oxidoreductase [Glycomyces artemisiae]PRY60805.1 NAD(P)-dependent dehydrogenase (short-subunit alcohol dehydrogenase family) [Glycomyces artemisiae]